MKLRNLNGAIRNADTVRINFNAGGQTPLLVAVQKTSLLEALAKTYPTPVTETGLWVSAQGWLMKESDEPSGEVFIQAAAE